MTKLSTLCYIEKDDKYLMLHRTVKENDVNKDKWIGVGGHFEYGESPEECLLREVKEETGYTLTSWAYRGIVTFVYGEDVVEYMSLYTADGFEGEPIDCDEGELEWVEKSKIETLKLWEGDKIFFDLLERDCGFFSLKLVYNIEDILKSIYDNKLQIEREKQDIDKNLAQIQTLRKELEKENTGVKQKEKELIETAKLEARNILLSAKEEANEIIKQLNNINHDLKSANSLRNSLNDKIKQFDIPQKENGNLTKSDIQLGMLVEVIPFNTIGTVISFPSKSNEVQIQMGNTKMNISLSNLKKTAKALAKENFSTTKVNKNNGSKSKYISPEINVIGQNVDEATYIIDKYLDDCTISNIATIRIVHGKGTGKLREGIHSFLKKHPHVKSFRLGTFGEGEMGVTVVELK